MNDDKPRSKQARDAMPEMNPSLKEGTEKARQQERQAGESDKASDWPPEDRMIDLFLRAKERGEPTLSFEELKALKPTKH